MTIHHDKMAYGRLAKSSEDLSEEKLLEMLAKLKDGEADDAAADGESLDEPQAHKPAAENIEQDKENKE